MVKVCVVKSCPSGRKSRANVSKASSSVSFFRPTTASRLQSWSQSLGIELKNNDSICQYHFKEDDIKMYHKIVIGNIVHLHHTGKKQLVENALPTIAHQFRIGFELDQQLAQEEQLLVQEQQHFEPESDQRPPTEDGQYVELEHDQQPPEYENLQQLDDDIEFDHYQQQQPQTEIISAIKNMKRMLMPPNWLYFEGTNGIEFVRFDPASRQLRNHIVLNEDLSITVICANSDRMNADAKISSLDDISNYLKFVERWPICVGTQIESRRYSKQCKGVIFGSESYQRNQMNPRCKSCRVLRNRLQWRMSSTERFMKECKRLK